MAVNKRKVLDAARKYVQKGAKEKALKEYERLLKLDPKDGKLRLEIGDAHRRWGQLDEAVAQYTKVADQYKQDGFDARSVAVYKQVLNLDAKRYSAYVSLSELYQRMGLDAEAIAALQTAAEGYQKEGKKREALELLRKMATLDPGNTTSRLKVAELLQQEGLEAEAISEYEAVAEELTRQSSFEQVAAVYARILEVAPKRIDILSATARTLIQLQQPERAEGFARRAQELEPDESDHYELLCDIFRTLDRTEDLADATRGLAKVLRDRGNDDRAREIMQRLPNPDSLDVELSETVDAENLPSFGEEGTDLSDDELLDDEFLATENGGADFGSEPVDLGPPMDEGDPFGEETPLDEIAEEPIAADSSDAEAEELDGAPEQLLAEASVYLRYGKRKQAIVSLKAVIQKDPTCRAAHEKLGDAYAEEGDSEAAVAAFRAAAEIARNDSDSEAFGILYDRIAGLDAAAAASMPPLVGAPAEPSPVVDDEPEMSLDEFEEEADEPQSEPDDPGIEFELGDEADPEPTGAGDESADDEIAFEFSDDVPEPETATAGLDDDSEIELDLGADEPIEEEEPEAASLSAPQDEIDVEIDLPSEDLEDLEIDLATDEEPQAAEAEAPETGESTTTSQQISEDLEEAEFYFQQGLYDEAEGIYQRILDLAPNQPSAMLRMGEIEAARPAAEESADELSLSSEDAALDEEIDVSDELGDELADEIAGDSGAQEESEEEDPGETRGPTSGRVSEDATEAVELGPDPESAIRDFALSADGALSSPTVEDPIGVEDGGFALDTEPRPTPPPEPAPAAEAEVAVAAEAAPEPEPVAEPPAPRAEVTQPIPAAEEAPATDPAEDTGSAATFDLAAELREAFEDDDEDPNAQSGVHSTVEDGFASIFSEFKKGVSETLAEGDTETRYDLGIAYKEMGLLEDAIAEFRVCLASPERRLDSLSMMGLCALDVGRPNDAINHFEQALAMEGLVEDALTGLTFDLARSYEAGNDLERARDAYQRVIDANPDFQDARERLANLGQPEDGSEDADEGFESFEDLTDGFDDEDEPSAVAEPEPEGEVFESFDDMMSEAEADLGVIPEPEATLEPEPEPDPPPAADANGGGRGGSSRSGKKKKISFV